MKNLVFAVIALVIGGNLSYGQQSAEIKLLKAGSYQTLRDLKTIVSADYEVLRVEAIRNNKIISDGLIAIECENSCSQQTGAVYVLASEDRITVKWGLWYNGGDCAIYGQIYEDSVTGIRWFVPASAATQYPMNVCGLSNVARPSNR